MKIKRIEAKNFRGARDITYELSDKTIIKGKNGSGKSTIASMIYWVFVDKDVSLVANPNVRTIGAIDEQQTVVTIDLDFSGKPVQIQKIQKLKRSKTGAVSLTNSYMVNSVPKSEKQFKEAMTELGVDFEKFLPCSHPGVLLAGINNKKERTALRNLLFQMASDITDLQVAQGDEELSAICGLLENYKVDEIEAMQNNTLKKIRENYGKEGEILRAKIQGLEAAKVEIDVEAIRQKIIELQGEYDGIDGLINMHKQKLERIRFVSAGIMDKKLQLQQMESDAVKDDIAKRSKMDTDIMRLENQAIRLKDEIDRITKKIANDRESAETNRKLFNENEQALQKIKEKHFDESTAVCPTCGQKLPPDGVERARHQFDEMKQEKIQAIESTLKQTRDTYNAAVCRINDDNKSIRIKSDELKAIEKPIEEMKAIRSEMGDVPNPDLSGNEEYQNLLKEIADDEDVVASVGTIQDEINALESKKKVIADQIHEQKVELAQADQNKRIDSQIEEAREQQRNYEVQKANAEMIIDQLKSLNKKKNELLQESVNSQFKLIEWKLWDVLKNGEYKDACVPMINGKMFGQSMNTALEILAKIDAMNGIQRFFKLDYPIILDDAEHLDSESVKAIESDHQLIMLAVSDDKELVFE